MSKSLEEVHASVNTLKKKNFFRTFLAFAGPAYLVSVGYMDPGNWAADLAGGSEFGYRLIWVLLMSNLMAQLLQSLSARLGIVRGRDLAQASRETYPRAINMSLYVLAEIAIAACDLAEVLGMAIGLQLLFNLPLLIGVCISVLDTFILLLLINYGIRKMEAFILTLVAIIAVCFVAEIFFARPAMDELAKGFIPSIPNDNALYIAIAIIGATVMPHNLYLHSSLVQTRAFEKTPVGKRKAIRFNLIDSTIALNLAFFVNAAILILAAAAFYKNGMYHIAEIQDAHHLLEGVLGSQWAPFLFAIALLAAGQSSTITGTLAGQIVMEGYLDLRIQPWVRRIITRLIAIVPAFLTIYFFGENASGKLLLLSQVILSLQLGFAVIPLIHFVSDKEKMGTFVIGKGIKMLAWLSALIIVGLNVKLVYENLRDWLMEAGDSAIYIWIFVVPMALLVFLLLVYITLRPLLRRQDHYAESALHGAGHALEITPSGSYQHIAIAVDFSKMDSVSINQALVLGGTEAKYLLIHAVETVGAIVFGKDTADLETTTDHKQMTQYQEELKSKGYEVNIHLGFGSAKNVIPDAAAENNCDLVILGAHGHKGWKDVILGTTIDAVRHKLRIPVLVVQ